MYILAGNDPKFGQPSPTARFLYFFQDLINIFVDGHQLFSVFLRRANIGMVIGMADIGISIIQFSRYLG